MSDPQGDLLKHPFLKPCPYLLAHGANNQDIAAENCPLRRVDLDELAKAFADWFGRQKDRDEPMDEMCDFIRNWKGGAK